MTTTTLPPLNEGQKKAAEGVFEFLFSPASELIISGPGGVGKTRLVCDLIDKVIPRYEETCQMMGMKPLYYETKITATTNKAAEVLATGTKRPTDTIHSFLNLKVQDDYSTGRSKLIQTSNWNVHQGKILFIDECSMIDTPLRNYILKGTHQSKIIYVGDHCQLAPVMENLSPIYKDNLPFFELTESMRTTNPALMAINQQLRETVETGVFKPIKLVPGSIDFCDDEDLEKGLEIFFTKQTHDTRILAYTNQRVMAYNDHIRTIRNLPDEYTVGEFLVNNSVFRIKDRLLSVEEEITILSQNDKIDNHYIEDDVSLAIRLSTIQNGIGEIFTQVPIPVNRVHYAELVKYYARKKNWRTMYHLKNNYPDFRQRDAATVHKAQGSSYDQVFIDLGNISTCHQPDSVARMLYVAFSRARHRVFLYGELASKYGGLIT